MLQKLVVPATEADLADLARLYAAVDASTHNKKAYFSDPEIIRTRLPDTYVFQLHGETVGAVTVTLRSSTFAYIDAIAVEDEYRRRGYGGVLLRHAREMCRNANGTHLWGIFEKPSLSKFYRHYRFGVAEAQGTDGPVYIAMTTVRRSTDA
jgi:GNAT superfamily N-acetyltransferase